MEALWETVWGSGMVLSECVAGESREIVGVGESGKYAEGQWRKSRERDSGEVDGAEETGGGRENREGLGEGSGKIQE